MRGKEKRCGDSRAGGNEKEEGDLRSVQNETVSDCNSIGSSDFQRGIRLGMGMSECMRCKEWDVG